VDDGEISPASSASPAYYNGHSLLPIGWAAIAVNAVTGKLKWWAATKSANSSPLRPTRADLHRLLGRLYNIHATRGVYGLDPATGGGAACNGVMLAPVYPGYFEASPAITGTKAAPSYGKATIREFLNLDTTTAKPTWRACFTTARVWGRHHRAYRPAVSPTSAPPTGTIVAYHHIQRAKQHRLELSHRGGARCGASARPTTRELSTPKTAKSTPWT